MNLQKVIILFLCTFCFQITGFSQQLSPGFHMFSKKKVSYITLKNGKQLEGKIKDLDYKKGLIKAIKIKDAKGKKHDLKPEEIKEMYLPTSGFEKFAKALDFMNDATKWENTDLEQDIIQKGYVFFEQAEVQIKKKKRTLMMQIVNPSFCSKVRIYHDPFAKETASLGVAGIKVAGGIDKSYYVKRGNETAYRLKKKDYKEGFESFFKDCSNLVDKYGKDLKWSEFATHVFDYTNDCD